MQKHAAVDHALACETGEFASKHSRLFTDVVTESQLLT